jgi:hypothetical protein
MALRRRESVRAYLTAVATTPLADLDPTIPHSLVRHPPPSW